MATKKKKKKAAKKKAAKKKPAKRKAPKKKVAARKPLPKKLDVTVVKTFGRHYSVKDDRIKKSDIFHVKVNGRTVGQVTAVSSKGALRQAKILVRKMI